MFVRSFRALPALAASLLLIVSPAARAQRPAPDPVPQPPPRPAPTPAPPTPAPTPQPSAPAPAPSGEARPAATPAPPPKPGPKPYADVITKPAKDAAQATVTKGMFIVHRIDDKVFFEIPRALLGKEMVWVTSLAQAGADTPISRTEVQDRVVRWTLRGDKVLLRGTNFSLRSSGDEGQQTANLNTVEPILLTFDVRAYGGENGADKKDDKDKGDLVIETTSLFASDVPEFSAARTLGAGALDPARTFIERVKAFPRNIEAAVTATYRGSGPGGGAVTAVIRHSIARLPDTPMRGRLADDRVGFFTVGWFDVGTTENRVARRRYITRWRLEKKDPSAPISEPVQPIVFYVGREVPARWRPYIKQGIEDWNEAFAAAGFRNAIVAKDPPSPTEDPDWDAEDARYSTIRWLPSTIENAYGPSIVDPRSGEIIEADIKFFHNILNLLTNWYFVQASPADPKARKLPISEATMGELLRMVTTHEVGHSLGFPHNMKASSSVSVAQLRSGEWTRKWGTSASIMDYARMNYVAQPGDDVRLIPKIGPYDLFAAEWGYGPLPQAKNPEEEKRYLDALAARQVANPQLRFGDPGGEDPTRRMEDLSSDPIAATTLGLKNLSRVLSYLVPAVGRLGEDYQDLAEMYDTVLFQRSLELSHVLALVGGVVQTNYHYGRGEAVYAPVAPERQRAAVRFLIANALRTPRELVPPSIVRRIEPSGTAGRILSDQAGILNSLIAESRVGRMIEQEATSPAGARPYTVVEMMEDLRKGVWSELAAPVPVIDPYRRNLQRAYISALAARIAPPSAAGSPIPIFAGGGGSQSDLRPLARLSLSTVRTAIRNALKRPVDTVTRAHLMDSLAAIDRALDPRG